MNRRKQITAAIVCLGLLIVAAAALLFHRSPPHGLTFRQNTNGAPFIVWSSNGRTPTPEEQFLTLLHFCWPEPRENFYCRIFDRAPLAIRKFLPLPFRDKRDIARRYLNRAFARTNSATLAAGLKVTNQNARSWVLGLIQKQPALVDELHELLIARMNLPEEENISAMYASTLGHAITPNPRIIDALKKHLDSASARMRFAAWQSLRRLNIPLPDSNAFILTLLDEDSVHGDPSLYDSIVSTCRTLPEWSPELAARLQKISQDPDEWSRVRETAQTIISERRR
jgi:hypothetical protein